MRMCSHVSSPLSETDTKGEGRTDGTLDTLVEVELQEAVGQGKGGERNSVNVGPLE